MQLSVQSKYNREYYHANRGKIRAHQLQYRQKNREQLRALQRDRYSQNPQRWRNYANEYRRNHLDQVRASKRRASYGIEPEEFSRLLNVQDHVCAICGGLSVDGRILHVDHDHATNSVRGLLCTSCNQGLGRFKDDPVRLIKAAEYLRKAGVK